MNRNMKIFSFFSGSGFLDLGFENNGFDVVFVNEYHKAFMDAYQHARGKMNIAHPQYGYYNCDINCFLEDDRQLLSEHMKDAAKDGSLLGFIGGPPCPDFSIAGKNKGRDGDNGKLSLSYVKLIIEHQPDFFLFENVKGLWRTARHRAFFEELKVMLRDAGYHTTERLTNALEFGAPQDRDRILLFGVHERVLANGLNISDFPWDLNRKYNLDDVKAFPWPETSPFKAESLTVCPTNIPKELTVEHWFTKNNVEQHPNATNYFTPRGGLQRMESVEEGDVSRKSYKRLHRWRYSPTVAYGNNEVHLHPYHTRRLTAAEALSLQTLPKEFELPQSMTLTDMFKTIGNGVPYVLSYGIAGAIKDFLNN